ncbi:hypothetical protein MMC26_002796 [Xylographa opegraphella]|nr:hypothetical protein [Xylographa opegraphella]
MYLLVLITSVFIAVLLFSIYHYLILPAFISPLSKIPNAHSTSFLPFWIWWKRRTGFENRSIFAAHRERGSVVRLGPNEVSVASLDGLRQIYMGGFNKDPWYIGEFRNYNTPNLVSMMDYKPHSSQKRMITNVYSKSYVQNSPDLQTLSEMILNERLLPLLQSAADNKSAVNVYDLAGAAGMDFMSAYIFGITNSTNYISDIPSREHYFKLWRKKERRLPGRAIAHEELQSICLARCKAADDLAQQLTIKPASSSFPTKPVVYSQFSSQLAHKSSEYINPHRKQLVIASELFDHLVAGHDTGSISLTYIFYELSKNPGLQSSLRTELLTLSPPLKYHANKTEDADSSSTPALPDPRSIDVLPLLNGIFYESLRLYTATPGPQPRITPPGGTTIDGYAIPGGVRISTSARCLHQNEEVYPEPMAFKPERWMDGDEKGFGGTEEMRRWFWAFSSGGRMCLGRNFATQVLKLMIAAIYTNYTTTIVDDEGIEQMDTYTARPVGDKLILQFHRVE